LTGLNRSTIAALVGELVELGLVLERPAPERAGVGRPSPVVHPNPAVVALAVNPDVDAVVIGLVGLGGVVHKRVRYETTNTPSAAKTVKLVRAVVDSMRSELDASYRVVGLGIAVPGLVKGGEGIVTNAPHLDWRDEPIGADIARVTGFPTMVGNDAMVAMLAEMAFGAGRDVSHLVYLNGSTSGIGGAVVVGGTPITGAQGYGAELGHTIVNPTGERCHCGRRGCLETEVNALRLLAIIGRGPMDVAELDQELTNTTDPALLKEMERQVDHLALAIGDLISVFNPESVMLGGFLGSLYGAMPERLMQRVQDDSFAPLADEVKIVRAELGPALLVMGAAELAFAPLLNDPAGFGQTSES